MFKAFKPLCTLVPFVVKRLWRGRILRVIRLDKLDQPIFVSLIRHRRKGRDDVDPRPAWAQRERIPLRVDKVHRAYQSGRSFPGAVFGRPIDFENLPVPE